MLDTWCQEKNTTNGWGFLSSELHLVSTNLHKQILIQMKQHIQNIKHKVVAISKQSHNIEEQIEQVKL